MSKNGDQKLQVVFGCPSQQNTQHIDFSTTATAATLEDNSVYRIIATEECFITLEDDSTPATTTSGVLIAAMIPEMFATTDEKVNLSVVSNGTDGTLVVTEMDA